VKAEGYDVCEVYSCILVKMITMNFNI